MLVLTASSVTRLFTSTVAFAAPQQPPSGVRVTLIEDDTALVSWREPAEPNVVVTRYNILYASQAAWLAGRWQIMQREGERLTTLISNRGSSCCPRGCCDSSSHPAPGPQGPTRWLSWKSWSLGAPTW